MLDQNTTTVLTTLITVLGTLGGVVLGVVLSNRYVARQEKAKRNTPIIEEAYTLIHKIDSLINDCLYNGRDAIGDISDRNERTRTLIRLYLPSIREGYDEYYSVLWYLMAALREIGGNPIDPDRSSKIEDGKTYKKYTQNLAKLTQSLEKLVK